MSIKNKMASVVERSAIEIVNTVGLSQPEYHRIDADFTTRQDNKEKAERSDVENFGRLTVAAGMVAAGTGLAVEVLADSMDNLANAMVAGSIGVAAVGAIVVLGEKIQR